MAFIPKTIAVPLTLPFNLKAKMLRGSEITRMALSPHRLTMAQTECAAVGLPMILVRV